MTQPRIMLATLALNEMEFLPALYNQHKTWPGLAAWVFVEATDICYAQANPTLASPQGLSVDGTSDFLANLVKRDERVVYMPFGLSRHPDKAQGKAPARNQYLIAASHVKPDWIIVLDADEFYPLEAQRRLTDFLGSQYAQQWSGICLRQRELWRPPVCASDPLFQREVIGGLWKMHHCHCWKYVEGMSHKQSHVWPETSRGVLLNGSMHRLDVYDPSIQWVHLGWAAKRETRLAKTNYYRQRGEGVRDGRHRWMTCRAAWENWRPGGLLPYGAQAIPYDGPVPEVFRDQERLK